MILGGGFAGITAAQILAARGVEQIYLINENPYFTYIPSLHEVVSDKVTTDEITFSLEEFMAGLGGTFVEDRIMSINVHDRVVLGSTEFEYDYLLLALGSSTEFYGIEQENSCVLQLKSLEDALLIRQSLVKIIECDREAHVHIIGGGATGVELATEIVDELDEAGNDLVQVHILEVETQVLSTYGSGVSNYVSKYLKKKGIDVLGNTQIDSIRDNTLYTNNGVLGSDLIVWTAGIRSPDVLTTVGLPKEQGRLIVTPYLNSQKDQHVFAAGDNIYYEDKKSGRLAIPTAVQAIEAGAKAAKNIHAHMDGRPLYPWRLNKNPFLISLGDKNAVFSYDVWNEFYLGGRLPALAKKVIKKHFMDSKAS